jgi:hypothetical protein
MDPDPGGPKTYGSYGSGFGYGSATLPFTVIFCLLQDCSEFLALLALQMGKLKKGATPDREMAARIGKNMTKFCSIDNLFMDSTLVPFIWSANPSNDDF